jgi:hypothetical protein
MSLTIGIAANPSGFQIRHAQVVQFEDDAYYWFLYSSFAQLYQRTGQFISLSGNACFEGESLKALGAALEQARQMALLLPEKWTVHDGTYDPDKVRRETLLTLLDDMRDVPSPVVLDARACDLGDVWREAWSEVLVRYPGRDARMEEELGGTSLACEADRFRRAPAASPATPWPASTSRPPSPTCYGSFANSPA